MTTLESPIARSDLNRVLHAKLEKSAVEYEKKQRTAKITAQLSKVPAPASARGKSTEAPAKSSQAASADKQSKTDISKSSSSSSGQKPDESTDLSKASSQQKSDGSKKPSKTDEANTEPAKGSLKFWDVAGYQLRPFKMWISVRIDASSCRKFAYKEYHSEDCAKRIATEFAKQCHRKLLEFNFAKNKKDKIGYMNDIGVKSMTGKETVSDLRTLLEQAIHRVVTRHLQEHGGQIKLEDIGKYIHRICFVNLIAILLALPVRYPKQKL